MAQVDDFTLRQHDVFAIIERTCSVFSLLGCVFIIGTFCLCKAFHKPINRLVFYASFGNLMTNVATLMAQSYINDPGSAGCQFQAFLIQMFMPADAFWTLAMAVNVYLTFYFKFDSQRLRKMEIPYLVCCYGLPFIIALSFIFVSTRANGRMYGDAALWCWVSRDWDIFRIATFYGPIWVTILVTFFIYIRAGREIYKKHIQLRDFSSHHDTVDVPTVLDPFSSIKTTEVFVTSEAVSKRADDPDPTNGDLRPNGRSASRATMRAPDPAYSVTISASRTQVSSPDPTDIPQPAAAPTPEDVSAHAPAPTPTPAPAVAAAVTDTTCSTSRNPPAAAATQPSRRRAMYEANNAAWSYTKCAILFFTAMLVTWIPSSANRVFSVVHQTRDSLALEYMSAFVLPLQGFWNAVIYVVTSWEACKMLVQDGVSLRLLRERPPVKELLAGVDGAGENDFPMVAPSSTSARVRRVSKHTSESSESLTGRPESRPSSSAESPRTPQRTKRPM